MSERKIDVAILGGGLAGNLLARQLRRTLPDLSVAVFERDEKRNWKVGEATVEIAATYLTRRLGLTQYLYERQLPKNGLRFFFDTKDRNADLDKMSEIGLSGLPPYPSFQLDRARLEGDLMVMNREAGVDIHVPARVSKLKLATTDGDAHTFDVTEGEQTTTWSARYVVDASGRASTIAQQRELRIPEPSHRITAIWGRFTNVAQMDDWPVKEFMERARYSARFLSTTHFCYPGQWIWFIPLRENVISVGVVCEPSMVDKTVYQKDGFLKYLNQHRAPAQLLEKAECLDMQYYAQLAYRTKQFFSHERWACIGDAAAFTDPFYSPGSDFISVENDLVTDLIARTFGMAERSGHSRGDFNDSIEDRVKVYNEFMHYRFNATILLYDQLYPTFGSFELFRAKAFFDCAMYYNLWFDQYMRDEHLDLKLLKQGMRRAPAVLSAMRNFNSMFRGAAKKMLADGSYYDQNLGTHLLDGRDAFGPLPDVGTARPRGVVDQRSEEVFNRSTAMVAKALGLPEWKHQPIHLFAEDGLEILDIPKHVAAHGDSIENATHA